MVEKRQRTTAQLANDERLRQLRLNPDAALAATSGAAEDDAALGIGQADDAGIEDRIAKLVEAAVEARLKSMGAVPHVPDSPTGTAEAAFAAFLSKFEHLVETRDEQRPGYQKPLTAAEIDGRKKGKSDMLALLRRYKAENIWPTYLLADETNPFYGPGPQGPIMYNAGQEIRTRLPPAESFQPLDDAAVNVFEAYKRWIGEPVSMEELTAQAVLAARGGETAAPEMIEQFANAAPEVQVVDKPLRETGPKRILGTVHPEQRGKSLPRQPGVVQQPAGPVFVGEDV